MQKKTRNFTGNLAVLDIGSTKVVCFAAKLGPDGDIHVTGIGHQLSKGIRSGHIVDFVEAETSVVAAVHAAEQMADETIESVVVSIAGAGVASRSVTVDLNVSGATVTERDMNDIQAEARATVERTDTAVIHSFAVGHILDDVKNIQDPRGMVGQALGADMHVISAPVTMVRNLGNCLAHCHLNVADFASSAYVSGLASLEPDEMELGVTLIDMGGGVTNVAVFSNGKCVYTDTVPIGGAHVTSDMAKGLSTSITHAERLKTLHGSAIPTSADDQAMIDVPQLGEEDGGDGNNLMPRSMLVGIIRPRLEEIFEMIRSKLEVAGVDSIAGRRVVLTGGASQLLGMRELATRVLGKQVRLSKPRNVSGLAEAVSGPAFSTAIGMLEYARRRTLEARQMSPTRKSFSLAGVGQWFKDNF